MRDRITDTVRASKEYESRIPRREPVSPGETAARRYSNHVAPSSDREPSRSLDPRDRVDRRQDRNRACPPDDASRPGCSVCA